MDISDRKKKKYIRSIADGDHKSLPVEVSHEFLKLYLNAYKTKLNRNIVTKNQLPFDALFTGFLIPIKKIDPIFYCGCF